MCLAPAGGKRLVEESLGGAVLEVVALEVVGVLVSRRELDRARIATVAKALAVEGHPGAAFLGAAEKRLDLEGRRALISRTIKDLELPIRSAEMRRLECLARLAPPAPRAVERLRDRLRRLANGYQLTLVDGNEPALLDRWLQSWKLDELRRSCLWSGNLGHQARFPSPYAFRWLARRLERRGNECLFVAGSDVSRLAAKRADWLTWPRGSFDGDHLIDLDVLADELGT